MLFPLFVIPKSVQFRHGQHILKPISTSMLIETKSSPLTARCSSPNNRQELPHPLSNYPHILGRDLVSTSSRISFKLRRPHNSPHGPRQFRRSEAVSRTNNALTTPKYLSLLSKATKSTRILGVDSGLHWRSAEAQSSKIYLSPFINFNLCLENPNN